MHDVAATAVDIENRGSRPLDARDRPARKAKQSCRTVAAYSVAAALSFYALRITLWHAEHTAGACVGTCAAVRDDAVRIEWLDSVRVLRTSA
jgi:hypothetical protein